MLVCLRKSCALDTFLFTAPVYGCQTPAYTKRIVGSPHLVYVTAELSVHYCSPRDGSFSDIYDRLDVPLVNKGIGHNWITNLEQL